MRINKLVTPVKLKWNLSDRTSNIRKSKKLGLFLKNFVKGKVNMRTPGINKNSPHALFVLLIEHMVNKPYKYGDNFHGKSVQLGL